MTAVRRKALVVDDDAEVRDVVAGLLESEGWQVTQLDSGRDVALVASSQFPDLVVMDVMMPLKNGFEAFKELRDDPRSEHIPVILLTGVNQYELGENHDVESVGRRLGVSYPQGFLDKPVNLQQLRTAIQAAMADR